MAVSCVLTFGQWGYPIQGLRCHGGAGKNKRSCMLFTCEQVVRTGACPIQSCGGAALTAGHVLVRSGSIGFRYAVIGHSWTAGRNCTAQHRFLGTWTELWSRGLRAALVPRQRQRRHVTRTSQSLLLGMPYKAHMQAQQHARRTKARKMQTLSWPAPALAGSPR